MKRFFKGLAGLVFALLGAVLFGLNMYGILYLHQPGDSEASVLAALAIGVGGIVFVSAIKNKSIL